jgi:hypothetical protein
MDGNKEVFEDVWEQGTDFLVCRSCTKYAQAPDVPKEFLKQRKRGFGILGRKTAEGLLRANYRLKYAAKTHCDTDLHKWCVRKQEDEDIKTRTWEEENRIVGENTIRAAVKTMIRGLGAADFQSDVDYLHLTPGVPKSQKNNSAAAYYELRNDTFEVVTERVKKLFNSGEITEVSATLDKVTIHHRSFTVLLTFFFYNGLIYCTLNELFMMKSDSYDSRGTAEMVVRSLKETLGLTRTQLATVLVHFAYDGVYASPDERVDGGGSLDLVARVAEELGLEPGSITGKWDFAHNLQIVWKKALGEHPMVEELMSLVFTSMDDYRIGQSGTIFKERAAEMAHLVLTMKKRQTTRFVRSLARGLHTFLRNLPTVIAIKSQVKPANVMFCQIQVIFPH